MGLPATEGFLFGVGVTVALVPEGLLPTISLSLALAARRMADRHALVRRLDAVETLGATTFICTDKTGTLTQNEMSVARACLDLVTDQLPALALGSEPPRDETIVSAPMRGHLVDGDLLFRVFAVLGPAETIVEIDAFTAVLLASGAALGQPAPSAVVLRASGAAFLAVVAGQAANAFACRSASRPAWCLPRPNAMLLAATAVAAVMFVALVYVPRVAAALNHDRPTPLGVGIALLAAPAVLLADAAHKAWTKWRAASSPPG